MNILAVKLPDIGEGVTEAELAEWHVKIGDVIKEDDVIAAVMTDKATVEIPSLYDGRVTWIGGEVGDVLPVGSDLIRMETDAGGPAEAATKEEPPEESPKEKSVQTPPLDPPKPMPQDSQPPLASPFVRARAREAGVDLRHVTGSGPAGRILIEDLETSQSASPQPSRNRRTDTERIKVVGMRRKIAERMALANARIPHITIVEEVDVTALEDLRAKLNADRGDKVKLTLLPFVTTALCKAFVDHPEMNAHYLDDDDIIERHAGVHLGVATMTDAGLVVPVLRHAEALGLFDTAAEIARLSQAARAGTAERTALSGSTFTITSLGALGALATTPIINHPEVAILGINKMAKRPMWDGGQFVPRQMMNISASFDHRVIDGWDAAVFVQRVKSLLETPALIFVEA